MTLQKINIYDYSKPYTYMDNTKTISLLLDILCFSLIISTTVIACFFISEDIQQGENYKIIYLHVPCAWLSLILYVALAFLSALYLIFKHPLAYLISKSIATLGTLITSLTLITGSFWGLPVWGTYWVWDARLTSMLVLLFFYIGYLVFSSSFNYSIESAKSSSILAIVGVINIPIVKFSVEWWNTLHQASSISPTTTHIDSSISALLLFIFITLSVYTIIRISILVRKEIIYKKIESLNYQE